MKKSDSDSEVIVHGYEEWGLQVLKRLRGMFAFSIWDSASQTLIIARDHTGIKPLYYRDNGEKLVWGSEIKSILIDPNYEVSTNYSMLGNLLKYRYVPSPYTLFSGILKLPPGHYLHCQSNKHPEIIEIKQQLINYTKKSLTTENVAKNIISETLKYHI